MGIIILFWKNSTFKPVSVNQEMQQVAKARTQPPAKVAKASTKQATGAKSMADKISSEAGTDEIAIAMASNQFHHRKERKQFHRRQNSKPQPAEEPQNKRCKYRADSANIRRSHTRCTSVQLSKKAEML